MADKFDLVITLVEQYGARIDKMAEAIGEVGNHCATLIEQTKHLATREDLSTSIKTHVDEMHRKNSIAPRRMNGALLKLIKAAAALLTVAAAAIATYMGLSN